jgi:hypothetical protein
MGGMSRQEEESLVRGCCWCAVLDKGEGVSGMASSRCSGAWWAEPTWCPVGGPFVGSRTMGWGAGVME